LKPRGKPLRLFARRAPAMSDPKDDDPINRLDQIIDQLGRLYAEADQIIDSHVEKVRERTAPMTHRIVRQCEPTGDLQ
jgi:hypothetical protein